MQQHGCLLNALFQEKRKTQKLCVLYDSIYITSWKRQNFMERKHISDCKSIGSGGGGLTVKEHKGAN